ncbi:MAG: DUF5131 family protein, partial [Dehalococcoidales bacterium]|nr:DUF5131 family protein [Dehalococcoidales bacterium]
TKQPQNLIKWSPFPDNCQVGVSVTNSNQYRECNNYLPAIKAKIKFVSFEPLLEHMPNEGLINHVGWLIIGQQTPVSAKTTPKIEWIRDIVEAADEAGIPVFLKDNLETLLPTQHPFVYWPTENYVFTKLRQEFPK